VRSDTKQAIGTLTVSIGVALHRPGESDGDFIGRADEALYRSKEAGRNRVTGERELLAVAS
jgi:diguanylate cyclase